MMQRNHLDCVAIVTEKGAPYNFGKGGTKGEDKCIGELGYQRQGSEQRMVGGFCNWCG